MTPDPETAQALIDANAYMTLATADGDGRPWGSPVWFAHDGYSTFYWVSRPEARHSQNLEGRPQLAIVIFDSTVPEGDGQAVYMEAEAELVPGEAQADAMEVFARRSVARGGDVWTIDDVNAPAPHRLYRAIAAKHFLLDAHDQRVHVNPATAA